MDSKLLYKLLFAQANSGKEIEMSVVGASMNPTLYEGDTIVVKKYSDYSIGDILVYIYKEDELLVHRLLDIKDNEYYCKGDNSFRLEDIKYANVLGKIIAVNGEPLMPCNKRLATLSLLVNRAFYKCRYEIEKTKETQIYKLYEKSILKKEEDIMIYKKNENMDYIQTDDTSLAVFDSETGDTHFFDDVGIDILNALSDPCDLEMLLNKLCSIYDASTEDIISDVKEFLDDLVSKKVVEII